MEVFFPQVKYIENLNILKPVLGNHVGSRSWPMRFLPPHTPWGRVTPSLLGYPGELLAHQASCPPILIQGLGVLLGIQKVLQGSPRATNAV